MNGPLGKCSIAGVVRRTYDQTSALTLPRAYGTFGCVIYYEAEGHDLKQLCRDQAYTLNP